MERRTGIPDIVDVGQQDPALRQAVEQLFIRARSVEKPLTSRDIERFTDGVVASLKKAAAGRREKGIKYVLDLFDDTLSPYATHDISPQLLRDLKNKPKELRKEYRERSFDPALAEAYRDSFARLKNSFRESLRQRLVQDPELSRFAPSDIVVADGAIIQEETGAIFPHVVTARDLNDAPPYVVRDAHGREKNFDEEKALDFAEGRELFLAMPEHPNILRPQAAGDGRLLIEKKERLTNLYDLILDDKHSTREVLLFFRDALEGGLAFEKHGLVIQDISLDNIGVMNGAGADSRGILHDIEYVAREGALSDARMEKRSTSFPDFFDDHPVSSSDMTYQFARSFEQLLEKSRAEEDIDPAMFKKFRALIERGKGMYGPARGSKSKHPVPRLSEFVEGLDELLEMMDESQDHGPIRWAA